jgi:hypothetical protein
MTLWVLTLVFLGKLCVSLVLRNDNEVTISLQIAHLECIASTMREGLREVRAGLLVKPKDEACEGKLTLKYLKDVAQEIGRLRREG